MLENREGKNLSGIDHEKVQEIRKKFAEEIATNLTRYNVTEDEWIEFSDGGKLRYNYSLDQLLAAVGQNSRLNQREADELKGIFFGE